MRHVDIIGMTTSSCETVFKAQNVSPDAHINAIGSYKPPVREIQVEIVAQSRIVMDRKESCMKEAGDLLISLKDKRISSQRLRDEIAEILKGDKPDRTSDDEITFSNRLVMP